METKALIRKQILAARRALSPFECREKSHCITERFFGLSECRKAELFFLYAGYGTEVQTRELCEHLISSGKRVAMPRVASDGRNMDFYEIKCYEELSEGYKGIPEPVENKTPLQSPDILVMPGVAFDRKRNRIGYGKGFYDCYLSRFPGIRTVAFAFDCQIVSEIPAENHDFRPGLILTETEIIS